MAEKKPPMPFKKEKLSPEAIDHFVEKHNVSTDKKGFPYYTQSGERLIFSPADVVEKNDFSHFTYLLSQTYPYGNDAVEFALKNIAYLYDGSGKPTTTWSKDPRILQQFTQILTYLGYARISNGVNGPILTKSFHLKPIIHQERVPDAPGE